LGRKIPNKHYNYINKIQVKEQVLLQIKQKTSLPPLSLLFVVLSTIVSYRTVELNAVAGLKSHPGICNAEEIKSVSETVSGANSLANSSACIKKEDSPFSKVQTSALKAKRNDTNPLPKCQFTSQLSLQGSRMLAIPNTNKFATKLQETAAHARTANIILCSNLNEIIDLKQDKIQTVTSTCEYLSLGNTDSVHHKDYHSDSSTVGDIKRNENCTSISDESYLNCDVESLCLEHAFRETNERIYPCRYCGEMFLVKSNLILHQTTYHSDHPVGCELCGKVLYKSRSEFMEHVCDHHSDNTHK
jgi:DNA-directed RNA polymerase subunit RPC12/RpoP